MDERKADIGEGYVALDDLGLPAVLVSNAGELVASNTHYERLGDEYKLDRWGWTRLRMRAGKSRRVRVDPRYEAAMYEVRYGGFLAIFTPFRDSPASRGEPRRSEDWPVRYTFNDIVGQSPAMEQTRGFARLAAQSGSSVLLVGESGTGKELFAHAIHAASPRQRAPFVPVDCSAIPRELLEAELFGYAPGAFTGATKEGKPGKFELAQGGTVFLDEIGEMPIEMQAKLLRVLQERQVTRVGGVTTIPVSFVLIAATNRDLERMAAQGRFRQDLLYRLDVVRIEIPPLRERPEDVSMLIKHYWRQKTQELGYGTQLSGQALLALESYDWPGNAREVLNMVERLLVTIRKPVIELGDLPVQFQHGETNRRKRFPSFHLSTVLAEAERRTLERALRQAQGNRIKAAQLVGVSRASFYRKIKAHGLISSDDGE